MTESESLARYGLTPKASDIPAIREVLVSQIRAAETEEDDHDLMKLCCIQLFSVGDTSDVMLIWDAKRSSFDSLINIDVQLLCGASVEATKQYLATLATEDAAEALRYLAKAEANGAFESYSTERVLPAYRGYYRL